MTIPTRFGVGEDSVLAVLGAGAMGRGIAFLAASAGYSVRIFDSDPVQVSAARVWIMTRLEREVRPGASGADLREALDARTACAGADVVIEAVVEQLDIKRDVLAGAGAAAAPNALLATNTSGLSVTAIASGVPDPSRVVGMHFFNPAHRIRLCEVVVSAFTSPETTERARTLAERLGKESVVVKDTPGFVASRLNCMVGNEALMMLQEGVASAEDIDAAARLGLNYPMGPLELLDLVGLDVRLAALETLAQAYGSRFRPTVLHRRLVDAGRLGRKTGAGVYTYDSDGRVIGRSSS